MRTASLTETFHHSLPPLIFRSFHAHSLLFQAIVFSSRINFLVPDNPLSFLEAVLTTAGSSVDTILTMSDLIDLKTGNKKLPSEGITQNLNPQEDPAVHADVLVPSDRSEESEIQDDYPVSAEQTGEVKDHHPVASKPNHSPSIEEQQAPKRIRSSDLLFTEMKNCKKKMHCIISVNERDPLGSLYLANNGFPILLFLNRGCHESPTVALSFRTSGTESGKDIAKNVWDTHSVVRREWGMSHIAHSYTSQDGADPRLSNPLVLAACRPQDTSSLMYLRFELGLMFQGSIRENASMTRAKKYKMLRKLSLGFKNHTYWRFGSMPHLQHLTSDDIV